MQIIHKLTVLSIPNRVFEVGTEVDGREVIEIRQYAELPYTEFCITDENGDLIASVENAPVIVDWKQIVEHGDPPEMQK
ncbi:hypothetical protein [Paenibacillus durus]|uniref:Uncharacterized protein n=1 Tax=Paenibacillus durus ATCC 35681 TaxID=1333534 RepID=A0A0F7FBN0_PAEDU|nr:hypothetical protein [Paenibacillus durus]AKG36133.1 hypothetical protein VK70_17495 [Paenibacillus durus ATCC 35681]